MSHHNDSKPASSDTAAPATEASSAPRQNYTWPQLVAKYEQEQVLEESLAELEGFRAEDKSSGTNTSGKR